MRWIALLLGAALAATYVSPAVGGPDLAGQIRRVDRRENQHYTQTDRRLKALVQLVQLGHNQTVRTNTPSAEMRGDGRFFSANVYCPAGQTVTGGGVDWATTPLYHDWHIVESAPYGNGWKAAVDIGNDQPAPHLPAVYAVCASI